MSLVQRVGDFDCVLQHLMDRQRAFLQTLGQRLPFEIFHHQIIGFVLVPDVVECADVGMI